MASPHRRIQAILEGEVEVTAQALRSATEMCDEAVADYAGDVKNAEENLAYFNSLREVPDGQ